MTGPEKNYLLVHDDLIVVDLGLLNRTLDFVREKARQNHALHATWNEGANPDFVTCTRTDCAEARSYLVEWGWEL